MRAAALLAWRNLSSRPLRTLLAAGGVVLGVALLLAVLISVRSMDKELRAAVAGDAGEAEIVVVPARGQSWLPREMENAIAGTAGVDRVIPQVVRGSLALGLRGALTGVPFFAVDPTVEGDLHTYKLTQGRFPDQEPGVVLEQSWAEERGLTVGDNVSVLFSPSQRLEWKITGLMAFQGIGRVNGGGVALMNLAHYQQATGHAGQVSRFLVTLKPKTQVGDVVTRLEQALGDGAQAVDNQGSTGAGSNMRMGLGFFAGVAALVGAFQIFGSFSLSLRQRVVETGLARAVGATGGQVALSLLLEAAGIGVAGGLVGLPVGLALSVGMIKLVAATGGGREVAAFAVAPADVVISLAAGVGVALLAAILPVLRTSRLSPTEALRTVDLTGARRRGWSALVGLVLAIIGLISWQWTIRDGEILLGQAFTMLYYLGAAMAIPLLVRWGVLYLLHPVARRLGAVPLLAASNLARNIERASLTAGAMMVAIAMVISFSAVSTSFWEGAQEHVTAAMSGDLILQGDLSDEVAKAVRGLPGVAGLSPEGEAFFQGESCNEKGCSTWSLYTPAIDPAEARKVLPFRLTEGDREQAFSALEKGGAIILSATHARKYGIKLGDKITARAYLEGNAVAKERSEFTVVGLLNVSFNNGRYGYISRADAVRHLGGAYMLKGYVKLAPGASGEAVAASIRAAAPGLQVQDFTAYREKLRQQMGSEMSAFRAILYIALFASALGIVNTLALSVVEQRRELALLRAVGATAGQTGLMVVVESLFLGLVGVVLGLVAGSLFANSFVQGAALYLNFAAPFTYPVSDALLVCSLALGLAAIAAVVPSWRAGRVQVMTALRAE